MTTSIKFTSWVLETRRVKQILHFILSYIGNTLTSEFEIKIEDLFKKIVNKKNILTVIMAGCL